MNPFQETLLLMEKDLVEDYLSCSFISFWILHIFYIVFKEEIKEISFFLEGFFLLIQLLLLIWFLYSVYKYIKLIIITFYIYYKS